MARCWHLPPCDVLFCLWQALQEAAADPHAPASQPTRLCHHSLGPGCKAGGLGHAHAGRASPERCQQQAWCRTGQQAAPDACQRGREKEGHDGEAGASLDGLGKHFRHLCVCCILLESESIALYRRCSKCLLSAARDGEGRVPQGYLKTLRTLNPFPSLTPLLIPPRPRLASLQKERPDWCLFSMGMHGHQGGGGRH
jgi:hypothetical protein